MTQDINAGGTDLFETINRSPNLAQYVTQQIENAIINGVLRPGDKLPTERELGAQFGVSRTVIREAVRGLVARNLVSVQSGAGTIVNEPSSQSMSESLAFLLAVGRKRLDFHELMEVRRFLEIETCGLAAERRTIEELTTLEQILQRMADNLNHAETFVNEDIAFHEALARSTHNRLFMVLFNTIMDMMRDLSRAIGRQPAIRERALKHHRAIYDQIVAGNRAGAREAMRAHLTTAEENLSEIIKDLNERPD